MQGKITWLTGAGVAAGLLAGSLMASGASAQSRPPAGQPGAGLMGGGIGMMGGAGGMMGAVSPVGMPQAVAEALGMTTQDLWAAQAAGKSVADLAAEKDVDLGAVIDAALGAHTAHMDAAVAAGVLSQTQAGAMTAIMGERIETMFQTAVGRPGRPADGGGMMGGRGMLGQGFGPRWRGAP